MVKYDTVVVGAGNAGLIAAARMALAGKKTLLIEQHNLPGGCGSSFCRGRFEFETGLHELLDFGPAEDPGSIRMLFDELGIHLEWCEIPDCFRCIGQYSDGTPMDVTMPFGVENYINAMEEYVPGSRPSMEKFFALCAELDEGTTYLGSGAVDPAVLVQKYPNMMRTSAYSTKQVFDALGIPQKAQDILVTNWTFVAVDLERVQFFHYAAMISMCNARKPVIPKHTSHEIATAILERFRELGGEVWFNCRAEKFLFEGNHICGVKTSMGDVACDYVLANIIYGKMMPSELVPEREKKLANARKICGRMFNVCFGLNRSAEELGLKDYKLYFPETPDTVKEYQDAKYIATNKSFTSICPNTVYPDYTPKGTCMLNFSVVYGDGGDWNTLEQKDYFQTKEQITRQLIAKFAEKTGVDISDCIEEVEIATPWTYARFAGTPEGTAYGYETDEWDASLSRMMMLGTDYPTKGLRPIGAAGPRGGGYSSAYSCGNMMAMFALGELSAKEAE